VGAGVEDEAGERGIELGWELRGERGGEFAEQALRVGAQRSSFWRQLQAAVLAAGESELIDQVVEQPERVKLGFLVGRADGRCVPPVGIALDRCAHEHARKRTGLGELDACGELGEQPKQRLERLFGFGRGGSVGSDGLQRVFEQLAVAVAAGGARARLPCGQRGC
jgi:hypothetical protein